LPAFLRKTYLTDVCTAVVGIHGKLLVAEKDCYGLNKKKHFPIPPALRRVGGQMVEEL